MTFFKNKLDKELGEAPRFSQPLQKRILQHVKHNTRRSRQYPLIAIGAVMITLLLLYVIGPWGQVETTKHATIVELAEQAEIKQFTMVQNWDEESFKAGRAGWIIGQQAYKEESERKLLKQILQQATITLRDNNLTTYANRDVWVEFDNGQVIKLKMYLNDTELGFTDQQTKISYKVKDENLASAYKNLIQRSEFTINSSDLITFLVIFIFIGWLVAKLLRRKFNIPKEPKYVNEGHQRSVYILKFLNVIFIFLFSINGWLLYTAATSAFLAVVIISSIMIEYYYGREEKRHYVSIISSIVMLLAFFIFFMYIF
ncbi:DUF4181 domain-containing protein [Lysinibacillus pakistanensis]|uniref:DUF4181 domain-containing protein n=1 Tax=Lysinibacillus pakistanensis TaxID=759811 RepID=UPI003D29C98F